MSDLFFTILLLVHICGGTVGLVGGTLIFLLKKGSKSHGTLGKLFIFGMLSAGFTSLLMAFLHPNTFLFMVGVFTIYLVGTGARFIFTKSPQSHQPIDRLLQLGMGLAGLALIYQGVIGIANGNSFGSVYVVFATIGLVMTGQDIGSNARTGKDQKAYIPKHLQRLGGGFIASLTAFLVVNIRELPDWFPGWLLWLLPTLLITPLIIHFSRKYKPSSRKSPKPQAQ